LVSTTEQTETLYFRRPGILIFDPVAGVKIAQRIRVHGTRIFIERDSRLIHTRETPKIRGLTPYSRQLLLPSHIPPHDCTKRHCWLQNTQSNSLQHHPFFCFAGLFRVSLRAHGPAHGPARERSESRKMKARTVFLHRICVCLSFSWICCQPAKNDISCSNMATAGEIQ
jgi:hypothetical protein